MHTVPSWFSLKYQREDTMPAVTATCLLRNKSESSETGKPSIHWWGRLRSLQHQVGAVRVLKRKALVPAQKISETTEHHNNRCCSTVVWSTCLRQHDFLSKLEIHSFPPIFICKYLGTVILLAPALLYRQLFTRSIHKAISLSQRGY